MNPFIKEIINQKIRQLTVKELIRLGQKEGVVLTVKEAHQILSILHEKPFDIGNKKHVIEIQEKFEKQFPHLYNQAMQLLKPYEHFLE